MTVRILLFASLAEAAGTGAVELEEPAAATVASLYDRLAERFPGLKPLGAACLCAVNREFARADSPVADGDEVAFFPPVSGG